MDIYELLAFGVVGFLAVTLSLITLFYHLKSRDYFQEIANDFMLTLINDEEMQKTIYQIGGILGSGVKGGIGVDLPTRNRGGKFKWQDLALEMATQFINKQIQNPSPSPGPSPVPQAQELITKKLSDKW